MRDASQVPQPKLDAAGKPVPFLVTYPADDAAGNFLTHGNAASVVSPHKMSWMFLQATVAILILVGFESVTAMGGEAKNAKRDIPIAVIVSLLVQGLFCYLFEYFAANYFLNSGYTMQSASGSAAPIGDMMIIVGDALFGAGGGRIFMLVEAFTVFLALIGTTLSCMNTGARVTYAMGKDREVPEHFGLLHGDNLTPHRAIWTLAAISAVVGCVAVIMPFGNAGAPADTVIQALPHGFWSSFGYTTHDKMAALPNSLLTVTLASNFGTFLLYALSCITCMVAYHKHPKFSAIRHFLIPVFGLVANLACMVTYLVGRSWASAPKRSRCWHWVLRWYGPFTAESTSSCLPGARGDLPWFSIGLRSFHRKCKSDADGFPARLHPIFARRNVLCSVTAPTPRCPMRRS